MIPFSTLKKKSKHSPTLIKHRTASIGNRLSKDSWDEKIFKEAAICYEDTLNKGGYINKSADNNSNASNEVKNTKIGNGT